MYGYLALFFFHQTNSGSASGSSSTYLWISVFAVSAPDLTISLTKESRHFSVLLTLHFFERGKSNSSLASHSADELNDDSVSCGVMQQKLSLL